MWAEAAWEGAEATAFAAYESAIAAATSAWHAAESAARTAHENASTAAHNAALAALHTAETNYANAIAAARSAAEAADAAARATFEAAVLSASPSSSSAFSALSGWASSVGDFLYWDVGATLYYLPSAYIETAADGTQAQSLAAWADGFIPFWDPFENNGVYSTEENPIFGWSQFAGGISRDALLAAYLAGPNLAAWLRNPAMYELGSTTIPGRLFQSLMHLTPVARGQAIYRQLGWGGFQLSRYATRADWALTIGTGLPPGGWLASIGVLHAADELWDELWDWWNS